jgi:hypothetical protein
MDKQKRRKWLPVFETHLPEEAHIISAKLQAAAIPSVIQGDTTRAFGFLIGRGAKIEVMVDAADLVMAQEILSEVSEEAEDADE